MVIETKYMSGAGNLFTVIDNRKYKFSNDLLCQITPQLCNQSNSNAIKTDGLIAINSGNDSLDFNAEFFNPDGSYGAMCGNGSRCAVMFAHLEKIFPETDNLENIKFSMAGNIYIAQIKSDKISVFFPAPIEIISNLKINLNDSIISAGYVNVNSDHLVININAILQFTGLKLQDIPINDFAPQLRYHKHFAPRGVNVNIYSILDNHILHLRTYERGVEGETGACGTGTISTALIAESKGEVAFPVTVFPTSGIPLLVDIKRDDHKNISSIILEGTAEFIGHGNNEINM